MDKSVNNKAEAVSSDDKLLYKINMTVSLIILIIGLVCVGLSAFNTYEFFRKNEEYVETIAKVSSYEVNDNGLRAEIVTYEVDGEKYDLYTKNFKQKINANGTIVAVKYDPNNPSDAILSSDTLDVVFPAISLVMFIVGIVKTIRTIKSKKKKNTEEIKDKEEIEEKNNETPEQIVHHKGNFDYQTLGELKMPSNNSEDNKE